MTTENRLAILCGYIERALTILLLVTPVEDQPDLMLIKEQIATLREGKL